jgi:hypothetical protein
MKKSFRDEEKLSSIQLILSPLWNVKNKDGKKNKQRNTQIKMMHISKSTKKKEKDSSDMYEHRKI